MRRLRVYFVWRAGQVLYYDGLNLWLRDPVCINQDFDMVNFR
jgi:hypothetical protein